MIPVKDTLLTRDGKVVYLIDQDDLPSLENGDWHDGPHEYEDGYDDDGQGLRCVLCSKAKREMRQGEQEEMQQWDRFTGDNRPEGE